MALRANIKQSIAKEVDFVNEKDVVYTPKDFAKRVVDYFNPKGLVLDPCKGEGAFYDAFPGEKDWCEIAQGINFFEYNKEVDWIITNPPWTKYKQFIEHGLEVAHEIVYLLPIYYTLSSKVRLRLLEKKGFGIKEIIWVDGHIPDLPKFGYPLGFVHFSKGWGNKITLTKWDV